MWTVPRRMDMPNGLEFLSDMELENRIKGMNDRELLEFNTRQTYHAHVLSASNERRIVVLEKRDKKFFGFIGSIGTFVGAVIVAFIEFLIHR